MKKSSFRTAGAAIMVAVAAITVPVIGAPDTTDQTVTAVESVNPLRTPDAEAAWWHIGVRSWGGICDYDRTWYAGWGWWSHEVKRWAYTWTSDYPYCQRSGERQVNRIRYPFIGMPGMITR